MKVSKFLSGAHMILQNRGSPSIAVRCYYPFDLEALEQQQQQKAHQPLPKSTSSSQTITTSSSRLDDLDGFVQNLQWTVIFFILPPDLQKQVLSDKNSFPRRAMRLLDSWSLQLKQKQQPRILVLQRSQEAIQYLIGMTDALRPAKRILRHDFFQRQQQRLFLWQPSVAETNSGGDPTAQQQQQQAAATHAVTAVRQLAHRLGLAVGEADLLMRVLGTSVVGSNNNNVKLSSLVAMDRHVLQRVPMDGRSKEAWQRFFETATATTTSIMNDADVSALKIMAPPFDSNESYPDYCQQQHPAAAYRGNDPNELPRMLQYAPSSMHHHHYQPSPVVVDQRIAVPQNQYYQSQWDQNENRSCYRGADDTTMHSASPSLQRQQEWSPQPEAWSDQGLYAGGNQQGMFHPHHHQQQQQTLPLGYQQPEQHFSMPWGSSALQQQHPSYDNAPQYPSSSIVQQMGPPYHLMQQPMRGNYNNTM
jgi:hypothetical protein